MGVWEGGGKEDEREEEDDGANMGSAWIGFCKRTAT